MKEALRRFQTADYLIIEGMRTLDVFENPHKYLIFHFFLVNNGKKIQYFENSKGMSPLNITMIRVSFQWKTNFK